MDLTLFGGESKWLTTYFKIIDTIGKSERFDGSEGHHKYPKFIFGENQHLTYVTYRVHYLLHFLLYMHCKKKRKDLVGKALFPLMSMRGGKEKCLPTRQGGNSKLYHQARKAFVISMTGENNHMFGKVVSEETRKKQSDSRKDVPKSYEHADAISKALTGKKKTTEHVNKINKNPEKIAKTAAKHRGMKRSEETRKRISEAAIGRPAHNAGTVKYYDPVTMELFIFTKNDDIPPNLKRGDPTMVGKKKPRKTYYHPDTMDIRRIIVGDEIPEGYIKGDPTRLGKPRKK